MTDTLGKLFKFDLAGKTIAERATLIQAVDVMARSRMHCLLVRAEGGRAVGILSEHDIVSAYAEHGDKARAMTVSQLMTIDIYAAQETDTIDEALKIMAEHNVRHLPVLSGQGAVVDFLSIIEIIIKKSAMAA